MTKFSLFISNLQILFLALAVVFWCINYIFKTKEQRTLPPGPAPWPFIGNLPEFLINKPRCKWIMKLMDEMNSGIACIRVGSVHIIPVNCPNIAREILVKQDASFASRKKTVATAIISHGMFSLFTSPGGEHWKKMRKVVVSELVSPARLSWLHEKRAEEVDNLVRYVLSQCSTYDGGIVNIRRATRAYGGNVMRRLVFNKRYFGEGRRDGGPTAAEDKHVEAIFTGLSLILSFDLSNYLPSLRWLDFMSGHVKRIKASMEVINKFHNPIIESRIREWAGRKDNSPDDLLDVLILLQDGDGRPLLSSADIKSLISEIFHAGIDNTSNAAEWVMAEMINNPKHLQKAVGEIENVVGKDRLVEEADIPKLKYLNACARESFRLHPTDHFNIPHMSTVDTIVAGYFIPKGSQVILSRTGIGRNAEVWEEPLTFNPERHLNESNDHVQLTEPDLRFISFGAGRRGCVAAALGTTMTIMLLARLLQGFDWSVPPDTILDLSEETDNPTLDKPLHANAVPRLPLHMYPKATN